MEAKDKMKANIAAAIKTDAKEAKKQEKLAKDELLNAKMRGDMAVKGMQDDLSDGIKNLDTAEDTLDRVTSDLTAAEGDWKSKIAVAQSKVDDAKKTWDKWTARRL